MPRFSVLSNFIVFLYCPAYHFWTAICDAEKGKDMKEVFQEYGGVIVTIIAILSLIAVISAVIGTEETGIIGSAFTELIENFLNEAGVSLGSET